MRYILPGDTFGYRGTHRKPSTTARTAAKVTVLAVPVALAGLAVVGATPLAAHAAGNPVSASQKTCAAFAAWERHPSRGNLRTLITDSLNVPWADPGRKYGLGSDVYELGGDVLAGKTQYVPRGERYVTKDCSRVG